MKDPFSSAAIAEEVEPHTWRRLFGASAKTIPLREMPSITSTAPSGMTRDVVGIGGELSSCRSVPQRCTSARELSGTEEDILEILDLATGVVSAQTLATELECSAQSLRRGPLHRLLVDGRIEAVHGRGYRRAK